MLRIDGQYQPVEETPAFRGRTVEQRIHGRREPHHAQVIGERCCRADAFAVDAAFAERRGFLAGRRIDAGAKRGKPQHAFDFGRHCPGAVAFRKGEFFHGGASQSAAGREQGDRLDQIGLAGAVRPGENHRPGSVEQNLRGVIAAEIGQRQALDEGGGHW